MTSEKLSPRAQDKKKQIRLAAERLFLQNGFAATSMNAVTAEAGVSKQTVYSYYKSKEELLADVLKQLIHSLVEHLRSIGNMPLNNRDELMQILNDLAQQTISCLMQPNYLALGRVIIAESSRFPHLGRLFRSTVPELIMNNIANILEQASSKGLVNIVDINVAVRIFVGPLITYILTDGILVTDQTPQQPDDEDIKKIVSLYMRTIV